MPRFTFRSIVAGAGIAACLSSGVALAQPMDAPPPPPHFAHDHGHKPGAMFEGGMMVPGLGFFAKRDVDSLALSDAQKALLKQAHEGQRQLGREMWQSRRAEQDALAQQLKAGKLDPRALAAIGEKNRSTFQTQMAQQQRQWLALWDSLSSVQREKVANVVKVRLQRREGMMHDHEHGYGHGHRPMHDHRPGPAANKMPPSAPAPAPAPNAPAPAQGQ